MTGSTAGTGEIAGAIVDNSGTNKTSLAKSGTGTWNLSGNNTYTGTTTVGAGTLQLSGSGKISNAATTVSAGTLDLNGTTGQIGTLTLGGGASGTTAGVTIGAGGELKLGGNVASSNTNHPNGASITGGTLSLLGDRTFAVNDSTGAAEDLTISAIIQNGDGTARSLTKTQAGTLVLSSKNTYTGSTIVSNGTLKLAASGVIPNGAGFGNVAINRPNGTLELAGHNETVNGLTGNGFVDNTVAGT